MRHHVVERVDRWNVTSAFTSAGSSIRSFVVVPRDQHRRDPGATRGEDLLADAADGQDAAGERDLAGHRQVGPDRPLRGKG